MSTNSGGKNNKTLFGSLGFLGVLALKFKFYIFAAFKALTLLKVGWLISPILSIGFYAMLFGWPYAIAIMVLLLIHEMGHYIWMKALHLDPKLPIFIPGVGAYVAMTKLPPDQATHAWVALAGPLVGGLGCTIMFWIGAKTGNSWLLAAGSTGFTLNLLQLIPAKPLDGGFVIQAVSRWFLIPGTLIMLAVAFMFQSVLLLIISGFSIFALIHQFFLHKRADDPQSTSAAFGPTITPSASETAAKRPLTSMDLTPATVPQRVMIAIAYLGLAGMLAYLHWLSNNDLVTFLPPK
jgi:Zn-dependent protease